MIAEELEEMGRGANEYRGLGGRGGGMLKQ
jgi:hypothetical protein